MTTSIEPKLAPPGAGLPFVELVAARLLFGFRRWTGNRDQFTAKFQAERAAIRELLRDLDEEKGARRALIDRPRGLEDSSRYWSIWMTLDHLRIIHEGLTRVIGALISGQIPPGRANTAAVKPSPTADGNALAAYEASCDALLASAAAAPDLHTAVRYTHPWFGPLDAAGWYALAGGHLSIHRVQIERILAQLAG
jgi:hypothetical protein